MEQDNLLIHDFKNKYYWGIWVRYGIAGLGLLLLAFSFLKGIDPGANSALVIFILSYNLLAHLIYVLKKPYRLWGIISLLSVFLLFDLSAVTFLIYNTGWVESPYWFLYLVLIIVSGFGVFSRYSYVVFFIAFFSVLFYVTLLYMAYTGALPIYGTGFTLSPLELFRSILNKAIFMVVSFFLFASTIYYFSKLLNQNQEEISKKNKDLLAALEEFKDIDRMKNEFISTASHELRTPLAAVRENISLIKDRVIGEISEKQEELLHSSLENVDRLARILDNLLDISKIESRSLELKRQRTDISLLADKAMRLLRDMAEKKKITLNGKFDQGAFTWVDPDQILRVFINLLDNAIKYTNEKGEISIEVVVAGNNIKGSVRDNGIGIADKDLPLVFERFVRLEQGEAMTRKGSGLGLSICKGIIEMHHGKMWVESKEGEGSKFIFTLPKIEINE